MSTRQAALLLVIAAVLVRPPRESRTPPTAALRLPEGGLRRRLSHRRSRRRLSHGCVDACPTIASASVPQNASTSVPQRQLCACQKEDCVDVCPTEDRVDVGPTECVDVCPTGMLQFGFTKPSGFLSWRKWGSFGVSYDATLGEELCAACTFLVVLVVSRSLYGIVPFFLAMALGALGAWASIVAIRLGKRRDVRLGHVSLKRADAITPSGRMVIVAMASAIIALAFCAWDEIDLPRANVLLMQGEVDAVAPVIKRIVARDDRRTGWMDTLAAMETRQTAANLSPPLDKHP